MFWAYLPTKESKLAGGTRGILVAFNSRLGVFPLRFLMSLKHTEFCPAD
jgi:hypothetical protein